MGSRAAPADQDGRNAAVAGSLAAPLLRAWLLVVAPASVVAAFDVYEHLTRKISPLYFGEQDILVAVLFTLALGAVFVLRPLPAGLERLRISGRRLAFGLAAAVLAVGVAGYWLVCDGYRLSMDEYVAEFGARIFQSGRLAAPAPAEWRDYLPALQSKFVVASAGNAAWTSGYLPVNSAFIALFRSIGLEPLLGPLWAAVSVVAAWASARRLWPDRADLAAIAAVLLATSAQLIFNAMTAYPMGAHLALNMVWLWLFLCGGRAGHLGALVVGFLATGLHQLVFHPAFAAPFVLELWLARRWRLASAYTLSYAAICLFWIEWWRLVMPGGHSLEAASPAALSGFFGHVADLFAQLDARGPLFMAENLVRLATWQNLLSVPLAVLALAPALRTPGPLRALALGPLLMLAICALLIPYQGYGWGYRYLHGFLGSIALLAAFGWDRLTGAAPARALARSVLAVGVAVTVALLPLRAWQMHAYIQPFAAASRALEQSKAPVVIVDTVGVWYGFDLVRNDPLFRRGPILVKLAMLDVPQARELCRRHAVFISASDLIGLGLRRDPDPIVPEAQATAALSKIVGAECITH